MAAPVDVRVEALSITSVILRWVYPGSAQIGVWRSTDGVSYAEITNTTDIPRVPVGTTEFTDVDLDTSTKYWYKLSDDNGGTFSSVVTVITHTCGVPPAQDSDVILPRFGNGEEWSPEVFNDLSIRVETGLVRFTNPDGRTCVACIIDGALVIDCVDFTNCEIIEVLVTEDIRSISMPNCENDIKQIDFLIPPGVLRGICGWPPGMGFGGDECFRAPINGGADGRRMSVPSRRTSGNNATPSRSKPGLARKGGATGGQTCACVPGQFGQLTIKSCNANNSLNCSSNKSLTLKVCGGIGPYTWSNTGSATVSPTTGSTVTVRPPTNNGSAVSGVAYRRDIVTCLFCTGGACTTENPHVSELYGCNDLLLACTTTSSCGPFPGGPGGIVNCCPSSAVCPNTDVSVCGSPVGTYSIQSCDVRTAQMITDGCNPCGVVANGATVTVTDSLGVQVTIVLTK